MKRSGLKANPETTRAWQRRSAEKARKRSGTERDDSRSAATTGSRKALTKRNHARAAKLFNRNYGENGRRGTAVRAMGCKIAGHPLHVCEWKVDACHSTARGMGGAKGDSGCLWDGCRAAHREAGERRTSQRATFIERYGFDPAERAAEIKAELDDRFGEEPCYRCGMTSGHELTCPTVDGRLAARETR